MARISFRRTGRWGPMMQRYALLSAVWELNRSRIILLAVLLLLVLGGAVFLNRVMAPELVSLRTEQARLQRDVRQRQLEFERSGVPVSAAEQLETNLKAFNQLIPEQKDFSVFLGEMFTWADQAGLEIEQVNYQPKTDEETGLLRYGLSFSVKGDYAQLKKFVQLIEQAPRILLIEKISLAGTSAGKRNVLKVSLQIELATYFREGAA